jgi:hypothetical protein
MLTQSEAGRMAVRQLILVIGRLTRNRIILRLTVAWPPTMFVFRLGSALP